MPRKSFALSISAALVAACLATAAAHAQSAPGVLKLQDANSFVEGYLEQPPGASRGIVVGATIVGVRMDGPDGHFNPAAVRVRLGAAPASANERLCLKVISRDGRYFARAQYGATSTDPAPVVEFKTAYQAVLSGYAVRDVAASAYKAARCDGGEAQYVASQLTPGASSGALVVQVRGGDSRVRAQLAQGQTAVGDVVLCNPFASGPTVGYTAECPIKLPAGTKSGQYQIVIGETSSSGDIKVKSYPLALWLDGK